MTDIGARRPAISTVIACVALFAALTTGGAIAATKIGSGQIKRNAIRSKQIKNGQVKRPDLAKGAVTASKLRDGSVNSAKIADASITAADLGLDSVIGGPGGSVKDGSLTGADLAADSINSSKVADGSLTGADVAPDSLTGNQIDESTLGQVPSANTANSATSAGTASNADNLGFSPPSSYQKVCQPGAIEAHVYVKGSPTFPSTYTSADPPLQDQFNCTGATTKVQAKRTATGTYFVDFPGVDPAGNLVATGNVTVDNAGNQDNNDIVSYKLVFDPVLGKTIYRVEIASGGGTLEDREFSFSVDG